MQDPARLAAVRATGLLDAPAEAAFDRLAALAAKLLRAPLATVTLVDAERQFYTACVGMPEPLATARETPLDVSFCRLTVADAALGALPTDGVLAISDTRDDPRTRDMASVTHFGVHAYAGVPLIVDGQPVGTLCVMDLQPRAWTADERDVLAELGHSATTEVELRGANRRLAAAAAETEALLSALRAEQAAADLANQQLQEQQVELELTNQQLQENAVALEAQAEELAATAAHLEEQAEAAERARRETARVLAATADGVLGCDPDGRTTFANAAAERLLGYPAAELVGRAQHALIHHTRADGTPYPVQECPLYRSRLTGASARVAGEVFWRRDGTALPVEYEMTPVVEGGAVVGAVLTFRDVSERRAAEAERERLLAAAEAARRTAEDARRAAEEARAAAEATQHAAEEANAAKSQFLANMSHELRTPLNAIGGYTQLLELGIHGPVTDDQRAALGRVQAAQRRLLALINDVLNYAKLEGGRVEYDLSLVDVRDVVAEAAPLVEPQLAAKGLAFEVRLPDGPCVVWADRAKLGQVLVNLLSNAAKFTDAGRVTVDVATRPGAASVAGEEPVFLRVADTGRGIPREKQAAVFEPFVQVQTGYARTQEGTGLGLAISRDLARGMGGDLRVRSAEGVGSTFTVVLRRATSANGVALDRRSHDERRAEADRREGEDRRQDAVGVDGLPTTVPR